MDTANIILDNFSLHYTHTKNNSSQNNTWTLGPLTLTCNEGERIAIIGKSGSGKTSLLHAMQHYPRQFRKNIEYKGNLSAPTSQIMSVMQEPKAVLNPIRKVKHMFELLQYSQSFSGQRKKIDSQDRDKYLLQVGLEPTKRILNARPAQLSGGMAQRVMLALCLAMHPQWVLADEISGALDKTHERQIMELLFSKVSSIILVTHRLYLLKQYCNRIICMSEGQVIFDGTVTEFFSSTQTNIINYQKDLQFDEEAEI